jgi:hypothetical protein
MSTALSIVPKQAIEQTTMSFVQERYQALDIADDPKELFRQAARLRKNIKRKRSLAATATPVGVISLAVGFGVLVFYLVPFTLDFFSLVLSCAFAAAGWRFLDFGFQSERRARYGKRGNLQSQYEIPDSDHFARVFEPVSTGDVQLAQVSISGAGSNFTPVTNQLIEKYVAGETAFADAWLPAELLYEPKQISESETCGTIADPDYVVIQWIEAPKPELRPRGSWKQYYLWHLDPQLVGEMFDRAKDIYPGKKVERVKARIAVTTVCEHFKECREQQLKVKSQSQLAKVLEECLKYEASQRFAAGDDDYRESLRLARINISGELKSVDQTDPKSKLHDKPESWFFQLLSGDNETILPHLRAEAIKNQPDLPKFITD